MGKTKRKIAMTDLETSGDIFGVHEILEIGLVLFDPETFENHDRLDLLSIAWEKGLKKEKSWSLKSACNLFGIPPEPEPHNALNGAMTAYKLFRKLSE